MKTKSFYLFIFLIFSGFALAQEKMPLPPTGYIWINQVETKSAFLKPEGWFYKAVKQDGVWGYFLTKENLDKEGRFLTGFSVFIDPRSFKGDVSDVPKIMTTMFDVEVSRGLKVIAPFKKKELGPFKGGEFILERKDKKEGDYVTYHLMLVNGQTKTMYSMVFEAPAESWEKEWAIGKTIVNKFMIDSDI